MKLILVLTGLLLMGLAIGKWEEGKVKIHYQHPTCTIVQQVDRGPLGLEKTTCTTQIVMKTL